MKKKYLFLLIIIPALILSSCSSSEETTEKKDDVYIFDEIPADTSMSLKDPVVKYPDLDVTYYLVQVGAYTTREKAEDFAAKTRNILQKEVSVTYSPDVNLYVVQLTPLYTSRADAEQQRNKLWQMKEFTDAWILTVNK